MFIFALVWKCTDSCTRHRQTPRLSTAVQEASRTATTPCHLVGISDLGAQQQQSMDDLTFSRKIGLAEKWGFMHFPRYQKPSTKFCDL